MSRVTPHFESHMQHGLNGNFADGHFSADEAGGGTIWGLMWFALLVGICGLAVDTTDGFRTRTMLQATADATALAAAIDLPDPDAVVATAVSYSVDNMGTEINGSVLDPVDVHVGVWDAVTLSLDTGAPKPDAVMVTVRRAAENDNELATNFLRIVGLTSWNVNAQAVAQRFIPECLRDGLVSAREVNISSNNGFVNEICVHGQQGVNLQSNNYFEAGVNVSMYDLATLELPSSGFATNDGLRPALRESSLLPRDVNHVDEIMESFLDPEWERQPSYITATSVIERDEKFNLADAKAGNIYYIKCKPNKLAQIPSGAVIHDVVIIADCEFQIAAGAFVYNAVLGSRSGGNGKIDNANITVAANVQLGQPDNCAEGGGVQLFSNATVHTSSSTHMDGVQIIAAGDVELGAASQGVNGISVQAAGDITMTSNNMFGLCSGGVPNQFFVDYYRLVL